MKKTLTTLLLIVVAACYSQKKPAEELVKLTAKKWERLAPQDKCIIKGYLKARLQPRQLLSLSEESKKFLLKEIYK